MMNTYIDEPLNEMQGREHSPLRQESATEQAAPPAEMPPAPQPAPLQKPQNMQLTPREQELRAQTRVYWHHLLTGDTSTVPDDVRRRSGADEAGLSPEEQDYRICSTLNRSWVVDHKNMTRETVRASWPSLRRELAAELQVADDEHEIFLALSRRHDEETLRQTARAIHEQAFQAGLRGEPVGDIAALKASLPEENRAAADAVAAGACAEGRLLRERLLPIAEVLSDGMEGIAALEEDMIAAPRFLLSAPSLMSAVDTLADMTEQDKDTVYYLAMQHSRARRPAAADEGLVSRTVRAVRRGAAGLGMGLIQGAAHLGIATTDNIGRQLGESTNGAWRGTAAAWDKRMRTLREVRHATQHELIPLAAPGAGMSEEFLLHAAEAVPSAVLGCSGMPGFMGLTSAGMGEAVAEARRRSPQTPQQMQLAAGVIGGAVQASVFMGMSRLGGQLLEKSVNNFMRARGSGAGAFSWAALKSMGGMTADGVRMMLAGKAAAGAELAMQELASRAAATASGIDWQQFGDNLTDIEVNMREAAATLPFILIGAGRAALRHFRAPYTITGDGTRLLEWGIEESKVADILNERNLDRRNTLLTEALTGSKRWSGPGFLIEAVRALRLLNSDYFRGFERADVVRDFLKLPGTAEDLPRPDLGERTTASIQNTPGNAVERFGYKGSIRNKRYQDALALWDEWWMQSHIDAPSSSVLLGEWQSRTGAQSARYERMARYLRELQSADNPVPERMRSVVSSYAPRAEAERRALLRDRVAEIRDLSYQFLMNVNSFESIVAKDYGIERIRMEAERSREEFLASVGRALIRVGLGYSMEENMAKFSEGFQSYYLRKKYRERGARVNWIHEVPSQYLRSLSKHALSYAEQQYEPYPELQEAFRIYLGVRTNVELLAHLLPLTEDFQTALSRGMSPAQAFAHLAERELGYSADNIRKYPGESMEESLNVTPMEDFTRQNERQCEMFMQLTGCMPEQEQGDDGVTYWRLLRPDGSYSRWHESAAYAMNDVGANAALTFLPLGVSSVVGQPGKVGSFVVNLAEPPVAADGEFSGYDQLCSYAMRELSRYWLESAHMMQPGFKAQRLRMGFRHNKSYGNGYTPVYREPDVAGAPLAFDIHTMATPMGLAAGRFFTYWHRMLQSGTLPMEQATAFLEQLGDDWAAGVKALPENTWADDATAVAADALGRFTQLYFLMRMPQLHLPKSVRDWFGYAAFCPPVDISEMPDYVALEKNHSGITRWNNRRMAQEVRALVPQLVALRERFAETPLPNAHIEHLMQGALGLDRARNEEQEWCFRMCGEDAVHVVSQKYWTLLQSPLRGWNLLDSSEQHSLREYLLPFCEQAFSAAPGSVAEPVTAALQRLDSVLEQYPQLHAYSLNGEGVGKLLALELPTDASQQQLYNHDVYSEPMAFYYPQSVQNGGTVRLAEESVLEPLSQPEVRQALQLLDVLRRYPAGLPYYSGDSIWWNNVRYGGEHGKAPAGLEHYQAQLPLAELRRLLLTVHEMCREKGTDFIDVRGIPLPDVSPNIWELPQLRGITVYRLTDGYNRFQNISQLCRLMPGDSLSPDAREQTPYVVDVRDGRYMGESLTLSDWSDPVACMVPLLRYTRLPSRKYADKRAEESREELIRLTLDQVCALAQHEQAFMADRRCGKVSMAEQVMRLFEDTNFSAGVLAGKQLHEMGRQMLRAVRLAADMLNCLAVPSGTDSAQAKRAFNSLQRTLRLLSTHGEYYQLMEYVLGKGSRDLMEQRAVPSYKPMFPR